MSEITFDERIARSYRTSWPDIHTRDVVDPIVDGLAGLNLEYPRISKSQAKEIAEAKKSFGGDSKRSQKR